MFKKIPFWGFISCIMCVVFLGGLYSSQAQEALITGAYCDVLGEACYDEGMKFDYREGCVQVCTDLKNCCLGQKGQPQAGMCNPNCAKTGEGTHMPCATIAHKVNLPGGSYQKNCNTETCKILEKSDGRYLYCGTCWPTDRVCDWSGKHCDNVPVAAEINITHCASVGLQRESRSVSMTCESQ
jgi:hypothetical protein